MCLAIILTIYNHLSLIIFIVDHEIKYMTLLNVVHTSPILETLIQNYMSFRASSLITFSAVFTTMPPRALSPPPDQLLDDVVEYVHACAVTYQARDHCCHRKRKWLEIKILSGMFEL